MFYPSFVLIDLAAALKSSKISKYATVRGNGSDTFSTNGRPTVNKSYLRQKISLRARHRERAAFFKLNLGLRLCMFRCSSRLVPPHTTAGRAPLVANGPPAVGVRFPVAVGRLDRGSGLQPSEAHHAEGTRWQVDTPIPACPHSTCQCHRPPLSPSSLVVGARLPRPWLPHLRLRALARPGRGPPYCRFRRRCCCPTAAPAGR